MRVAWAIQGIGYIVLGIIIYVAVQQTHSSTPIETARTKPMNDTLIVRSPAFTHGQPIPSKYTCDGEDMSPPIALDAIPEGTVSLVLIVDDPDAPNATWDHWVVFNIPASTTRIGEGEAPVGVSGKNSWDKDGYGGPCPPQGEHRYFFSAYALDTSLRLTERASKTEVLEAMKGHILATGVLLGTYARP